MDEFDTPDTPEPRWPVVVALLAVGGIYLALPESLAVGPRWLQLVIVIMLLIPTVITHRRGHHKMNQIFGHLLAAVTTLFMIWSLALLVAGVMKGEIKAEVMLRSAVIIWLTNILVFGYWYWRLDGGGPYSRDLRTGHTEGAFLFPQMALGDKIEIKEADGRPWSPRFIDYLFIAFNTSTAFSPTDCPVLSRWAKVLTMLQSLISLTAVVILAARAVNIIAT